jgi:hypothetical protein
MKNDRFVELVHYIVDRCEPHELGAVKLNKALWFADREAFIKFGRTLTGREYIKLGHGPVPKGVTRALDELKRRGLVEERRVRLIEYARREFVSLREPDMSGFSSAELDLVDAVIAFVRARTAGEISALSHDDAWDSFAAGEEIPIHVGAAAAFLAPVTEEKFAWAGERLAAR